MKSLFVQRLHQFAAVLLIVATGLASQPVQRVLADVPTSTPAGLWLTVTSPNGGEVMTVGDVFPITWQSSANIDTVYIGYKSCPSCLDSIVTGIPNTGSYNWTVYVGNTVNTQFTIEITGYDTGVGSVTDDSDAPFTVLQPSTPTLTPISTNTATSPLPSTYTPASTPTPAGTTAGPWIVTSNADDGTATPSNCPSASNCRLRDAIAAAPRGSVITFASNLADQTITLAATLTLNQDVTLDGSALASQVTISGNNAVQLFYVNPGVMASLKNLTIMNGNAMSGIGGGGINNDGTLTVTGSTFSSNSANNHGGGINNNGTLTVTGSTFSGNFAGFHGGGISNSGALTVTNSTFQGNTATYYGGGIINSGTLTVTNSTFYGNSAGNSGNYYGGGIFNEGTLNFANTIIANSTFDDCLNDGTLGTNLSNLVEDGSCSAGLSGDPELSALANNGGPTQTMALLAGSPAIDAGNDASCPSVDQRGVSRPQGAHCDIGAFEYVGISSTATFTPTVAGSSVPTILPTEIPTFTPLPTSTPTPTPVPPATATFTPVPSDTMTPTATATLTPTNTATATPLPAPYFLNYRSYPPANAANAVAVGDFNSDGLLDVAMTTGYSPGSLLIYLQNSDGTLAAPVSYNAGPDPRSLAAGDINHDGRTDIVVTNSINNYITVFLQQPDGTLANGITYPSGSQPDAIAIADLNGDGLPDVVVSHWSSPYIGVFTQNQSGALNAMVTYPAPQAGWDDLAVGDLNGDGLTDVVKMDGQGSNEVLSVYLQQPDGTLSAPRAFTLGSCGYCLLQAVRVGDVTGDGRADLAVTYYESVQSGYDAKVAVFAQGSDGQLLPPVSYPVALYPQALALADVNLDGRTDVVVPAGGGTEIGVSLQRSDGTLQSPAFYTIPYTSQYNPEGLAVGDINHDGKPDLILANYNNGLVVLYQSSPPTPTPTFTATASYTPTFTPTATSTPTFTPTASYTPTFTPTLTSTPTFTATWTPTFTPTASSTATFTPTLTNTPTFTATWTPTFTSTASSTPTFTATWTPTWTPTALPTVLDDPSYLITYQGWFGRNDSNASGGGYRYNSAAGGTASYTSSTAATSMAFITYKGPDQGKVQILVDNVPEGTFDLYNAVPKYKQAITITNLSKKAHTITVKVTGQKNPASKGYEVRVDAFEAGTVVIEDTNPAVTYETWIGSANSNAYGGTYRSSNTAGASITFTITGNQFRLITARGTMYGFVDVYKDGVYAGTYDLYNPTQQWQYPLLINGLGSGTHTIVIQVKGMHNRLSTGNTVVFDAMSYP
ncbi:MAG TPA: FG-GAP-like repeat-containing protein [Anaerolineales bacterium]|nr:FG-GAP-like repeat-containing protein [Anaerolineales bacterium]